jgi:hypothetical protein
MMDFIASCCILQQVGEQRDHPVVGLSSLLGCHAGGLFPCFPRAGAVKLTLRALSDFDEAMRLAAYSS